MEKIVLRHNSFRYLHQTNSIVFIITSAMNGTGFDLSSTNVDRISLFAHVIYVSAGMHCKPVGE